MGIKSFKVLLLAAACGIASAQGTDEVDRKMLDDCRVLAKKLNSSQKLGIMMDGIQPLFTWHASCAERVPTGPGDVTALCEGNRKVPKGQERVFFWEKQKHGKFNRGFFACTAE